MVYTFRATIPESKVFYRVYEIKGDMTLFRFNSFITDNLGFSPDQMVMFEGYDEKGALCSEYGLFDMGDGAMDTVTFDKVLERGETELHFVFDTFLTKLHLRRAEVTEHAEVRLLAHHALQLLGHRDAATNDHHVDVV